MNARLLFVHALSPLHAGTGQGVGVIDLPIAREKATNLPYLPGTSLKGVLRDACQDDKETRIDVFGPDTTQAELHAGSVHFTDQRLLLMPIRSLAGTFAWVTSPFILRRFLRDAAMAGAEGFPAVPEVASTDDCLIANPSALIDSDNNVTLEDIQLVPDKDQADAWAKKLAFAVFPNENTWQDTFRQRFCIVHDEVFGFLVETATEIVARIALEEDTKTVKQGALWYEESLPAESILNGLVVASPVKVDTDIVFNTVKSLIEKPLQLGGNATVGRGLCQLHMTAGGTQ